MFALYGKITRVIILVCIFTGIILSNCAWGTALPPEVMSSLKEVKILEITKDNIDVIWDLSPTQHPDSADLVDLKVVYKDISNEHTMVLQEWVKRGKGIILYSTNMKRFFPDINTQLYNGLGTIAQSVEDSHPVVKGVKEVRFKESSYSAIEAEFQSLCIPILKIKDEKIIAIACSYGRGRVIIFTNGKAKSENQTWRYSPLVTTEDYDNERFKINVEQWLAGAPVPSVTAKYPMVRDTIFLKNDDILSGEILNERFTVVNPYGTLIFCISDLTQIIFEEVKEQRPTDIARIILRIGDRVSGVIQEDKINIMLVSGEEIAIEKEKIAHITFELR
jgi:hypothetical protein